MRVLFEGSSDRKRKKVSKNVFKKTLKMDKSTRIVQRCRLKSALPDNETVCFVFLIYN